MATRLLPLTKRQKQVLHLVARAQTNKQIAASLNISRATVKRHVEIILKRLKLRNRIEVALYATRNASRRRSHNPATSASYSPKSFLI
jgi:DNA-binding NarL/FixJ family response regulator